MLHAESCHSAYSTESQPAVPDHELHTIDSPGKERLASPFILICLSDLSFRLISAFTSLSLAYFMVILEARESGEWEWTPVMAVSMSCKG